MEDILDPEELARKLKVHKSWVYGQTRETGPDAIPRLKVGKYLRFSENEVMDWLKRKQATGRT